MNVDEVDTVHVELLGLFKDAEVALAPHNELTIMSILYQGGREAASDHLEHLHFPDGVDPNRDRRALFSVGVVAAEAQLMLSIPTSSVHAA